jgi:intracellular multiplication protein IcmE
MGVSATVIRQTLGCSAQAMKDAGYTAAELRDAGFTPAELKNAGFTAAQLKEAGFSAKELRAAGFSPQDLKAAGFTAAQLKDAGFSAADLKNAGFTADSLKNVGFSDQDLKDAGFTLPGSAVAGLGPVVPPQVPSSELANIPSIAGRPATGSSAQSNAKQLQEILQRQQSQMADQRSQQEIQQRTSAMLSAANQYLQAWKATSTQVYVASSKKETDGSGATTAAVNATQSASSAQTMGSPSAGGRAASIKTGDVLFAVLDTAINSDEPGPILATIVSGRFKGAKLIGSFNLPSNADKMVINFNTMSVPGASKTIGINAYAIDPNTARTALSSSTDHHYLLRYGSLFAATFLEGFGNAFQSANTTITIGGTGGVQTTTVQNGVGRSILENAVIGLATLGKSWGQVAQVQFNRPTTVQVCSGTGLGILFTQDVTSL